MREFVEITQQEEWKLRGRSLYKFPEVPEPDRLNPQIIRQLLYRILERDFDFNLKNAAASLESFLAVQSKKKNRKSVSITEDILYNLIVDRTLIRYHHIQAIANYFQVPVFVVLAITRVASDARDGNSESLASIREFLGKLSSIDDLSHVSVDYLFSLKPKDDLPLLHWRNNTSVGKT